MLGHQDIAMEHYGAEPRPPIHKCLTDVADSDIYIGIIGRRYGWIPPESTYSITEQEYRQAIRSEKAILVFLLDDSAADWPEADETPDQQTALKRFREHLSTAHLIAPFASCEELERKVFASLANLDVTPSTPYDPKSEDKLFELLESTDSAARARARRRLVDMGSPAYAAHLRRQLRRGHETSDQRTADVRELAEIESRNHRVMSILRDLLNAEDPSTLAAVVFEFAQRGLQSKPVNDDDIRAILKLGAHESGDVRREVGHSMWKFLPRSQQLLNEMREVLAELVRDPKTDVQQTAMYSLRKVREQAESLRVNR
jgi:hypothetical protein